MTGRIVSATMLVVALLGLTPEASAAQSSCTWQTTLLTPPTGATQHQVSATDHAGGYSGSGYFPGSGWQLLYWKNGQVTVYANSGLGADHVVGQNRAGTIAAISVTGPWQARSQSFRLRDGHRELLPEPPGAEQTTRAVGISENGDIFGNSTIYQGGRYVAVPVRWPHDQPGVVERVPGVPDDMRVIDVDHDGTLLVGSTGTYPWPHLWRDGRLTRLPEPQDLQHGYARAITDLLVAGSLRVGSDSNRPAYWDRTGGPHLLPQGSEAIQINANGLIVSSSSQVWRLGTLDGRLSDVATITTIGDDDSIGGTTLGPTGTQVAAVWRCA